MKKKFVTLFFSLLFFQAYGRVMHDPYDAQVSHQSHSLKLRVFYHGTSDKQKWLMEQLHAARIIYFQCSIGLEFEILSTQHLPLTDAQFSLVSFENGKFNTTITGRNFFSGLHPNKKENSIDVHVVDHLTKRIRDLQTTRNSLRTIGQAFNPEFIRFATSNNQNAIDLYGNNVFLAANTIKLMSEKKENFLIDPSKRIKLISRNLSLLAHELGHILLEEQIGELYRDHFCESIGDYCKRDNLMSAGGNPDNVWKKLKSGKIIGYDLLPQIDKRQCEVLRRHPLLQ